MDQGERFELAALSGGDGNEKWIVEACEILAAEWPLSNVKARRRALERQAKSVKSFGLVETKTTNRCIGFGTIQPAGSDTECTLTSVLIAPSERGKGLGKILMDKLCAQAVSFGFEYMYLWTSSAQGFYAKLGFLPCDRVPLNLPVLGGISQTAVSGLEAMLNARFAKETQYVENHDDPGAQGVVWMRKRLVEVSSSLLVFRSEKEMWELAKRACEHFGGKVDFSTLNVVCCPWQRQVGPSCGLNALLMTRSAFSFKSLPFSLLQKAQSLSFSRDGEIFSIEHLNLLANDYCDLQSEVIRLEDEKCERILRAIQDKKLVIFPYDREHGTSKPCSQYGASAHYCIIIGFVKSSKGLILIAQHGMSSQLVSAYAFEWLASNKQLVLNSKVQSQLESRGMLITSKDGLSQVCMIVGPKEN